MCGILGISSSSEIEDYTAQAIIEEIVHRGPDDSGIFYSEQKDVCLGHTRLSIIDVSQAGHQPMWDESSRFVMVYNGEVYNYTGLKEYLEDSYGAIRWKSTSDSEVILEGFAREGADFLDKLNGIFSILIYDSNKEELHVLRDPIGIKPLYFTQQKGAIYFCSELKGLLKIRGISKTLRKQSLADQLAFMYVPEPFTMFEEFRKVEPGNYMIYKGNQLVLERKLFNHLHESVEIKNEVEAIEVFSSTFSEAVKRQLVSDVPVSLFLSGGLDSSAVAYEAVNGGANIHSAYTISFSKEDLQRDSQSSDLFYAKKIAQKLNLDLQVIQADPNFIDILPDLIPFMEDGISDPAAINTYLICKSARQAGIKVMLSGQGADEYLCGYRRYLAEHYLESMNPMLKKSIVVFGNMLPAQVPGPLNAFVRRVKRLSRAAKEDRVNRLGGYFMWADSDHIKRLFLEPNSVHPGQNIKSFFENSNLNDSSIETMLKADQQFDLLALNLAYSDKMSMAVGVEARVPFLDFELIRLMNSLSDDLKLRGRVQKYILKKAMEGKLPHEVIYRPKAGFSLPIRSWFKERNPVFDHYFNPERIQAQGIFDPSAIEELYKKQLSGEQDNSYILFSILCQQMWIEKNC